MKIKLFASKKQTMTIVGHSGCGGWALVISDTDEVLFIKRCDKSLFYTGFINISLYLMKGFNMPIKTLQHLTLSYDGNSLFFYVNGVLFNMDKKLFQTNSQQNLDIGYFSQQNTEFFYGEIQYL